MATDCIPKMNREVKNLVGQRFGRLLVEKFVGVTPTHHALWLCRCDCGNEKITRTGYLMVKAVRSCGCFRSDSAREAHTTHGRTQTTEFVIWSGIRQRTTNPNYHSWADYGGRGVKICGRWQDSFENFYTDMGPRPSLGHTIDRFPNRDGDYEPSNCRWATHKEQQRNRRNNRLIEYKGEKLPISVWTERFGFKKNTIRNRLVAGWPVDQILRAPEKSPRFLRAWRLANP